MIGTLIIGGGAAGLYASSLLPDATILEQNEECGRKLLLTGGGRCNYAHNAAVPELLPHYHGSLPFIRKVLYSYPPDRIIGHFRRLGIEPMDENGKIFPLAGDSHSVRDALMSHRPAIIHGRAVSIEKHDGIFMVSTEKGSIEAERVIIAAGGNAYPNTGSDGSGYALARMLGHTVIAPSPALAALSLEPSLGKAEGVSLDVTIAMGKTAVTGSAVITRRGISGPAAEDFSRFLNGRKERITISFSDEDIHALREKHGASLLKNTIHIPPRLASALLGSIGEKRIANLSKAEEMEAEGKLHRYPFLASPIASSAMSTRGGISTAEINADTMESRSVSGLYFIGDIIDVDADCGGYSLGWAAATAAIATDSISGSSGL